MKKIENKIMLITYANTLGGSLAQLERVLAQYFPGAFEMCIRDRESAMMPPNNSGCLSPLRSAP